MSGRPDDFSGARASWVVGPVLVALLQPAGWNDCPYEIANDPFPGNCGAYADTDNDGFCDHGQAPPEERAGAATVDRTADADSSSETGSAPDAATAGRVRDATRDAGRGGEGAARRDGAADVEGSMSSGDLGSVAAGGSGPDGASGPVEADAGSEEAPVADGARVAEAIDSGRAGGEGVADAPASADVVASPAVPAVVAPSQVRPVGPASARRPGGTRQYYFAWIALGTIAVYSLSRLLVARRILRLSTHRRLWNVVVLFGFLGVGTTGLLLVLRVSYGIALPSPLEFLFWHVEAGIVFAIVGAIHLWWHWKYYWRIVRPAVRDGGGANASCRGKVEER